MDCTDCTDCALHPTTWRCEACGSTGSVTVPHAASVLDGVGMIRDAHHEAAPECAATYGTDSVRVNV